MNAANTSRPRLMAHLVSHFPDRARTLDIARALTEAGAAYLEVQFPFSDPSADGSLIQSACGAALMNGFTVDDGFALVEEICRSTETPVFLMSYGNLVFRRGIERFARSAREAGVSGLIIPDLMPGHDEGLYASGPAEHIDIVPVVAPSTTEQRLRDIMSLRPAYLYASLRVGITGNYTEIGEENRRFLSRLRRFETKILAGFGISSHDQIMALKDEVHAVVVGSALVRTILGAIESGELDSLSDLLYRQTRELISGAAVA